MPHMDPLAVGVGVVALVAFVALAVVWAKGRPFAAGEVFRASRLSDGNFWFPTQVGITPGGVVHVTPQLVGRQEQSIHMAHVASVHVHTRLLFSDVLIETTGGTSVVRCHGHRKRDALRMKQLIEEHQTAYYRRPAGSGDEVGSTPPPG
jgi:hypothetical protein